MKVSSSSSVGGHYQTPSRLSKLRFPEPSTVVVVLDAACRQLTSVSLVRSSSYKRPFEKKAVVMMVVVMMGVVSVVVFVSDQSDQI
jgi:hypothetical protein